MRIISRPRWAAGRGNQNKMSWFRPKKQSGIQVGVSFSGGGVCVAVVSQSGGKPTISSSGFYPATGDEEQAAELKRQVREQGLQGLPAVVSLEPSAYTLLQVEAPEVEPDELQSAIRWRIKDLINFHIDDAVIDLYEMPEAGRPGAPRINYVVAARTSGIQKLVETVEEAGLELSAIDIAELSIRNTVYQTLNPDSFHALLYLSPQYGLIEILKGETLFLSRRIEINAVDLEEQGGLGLNELIDSLVLELQRSLDYHESYFASGSVSSISFVVPASRNESLLMFASESLSAEISPFVLTSGNADTPSLEGDQLVQCLPAIGAAMRVS
jgi:MSHA biogenesis protein MshI